MNQLQTLVSAAIFSSCGFQTVGKTSISNNLKKISPSGGTALRDSIISGCQLMLKLYKALKQLGTQDPWNFAHVILTDGADCSSKNSMQNAVTMMLMIGKLIPVKTLKIIIVGVGVDDKTQKQLKLLAEVAGENAEYYNVNSANIGNIFNKIQISLGLQKNIKMMGMASKYGNALFLKQEVNPYLQISMKNFAVMFNLDVSGSMSGNKWASVCNSVNSFISKMGGNDLVSALVFNDQVKLLSKMNK